MRKVSAGADVDFGERVKVFPRSGSILLACCKSLGAGSSGYFVGSILLACWMSLGAGSSGYFEVVDVEFEDVLVLDGVGDGVFV